MSIVFKNGPVLASALAGVALVVGSWQFAQRTRQGAGNQAPVVLASQQPYKVRPPTGYVPGDFPTGSIAQAEATAAQAPSQIKPKLVKTVIVHAEKSNAPTNAPAPHEPATIQAVARIVAEPAPAKIAAAAAPDFSAQTEVPVASAKSDTLTQAALTTPAKSLQPAVTPVASGAYFVQLAAVESESEAHDLAQKLQARLAGKLGQRNLSVIQANVKEKSIFRIRLSQISRDDANQFCAAVREGKAPCFVARD